MPNHHSLEHRLEDALESLAAMHRDGLLPPVLQPLLSLAPPSGMRAQVTLERHAREHADDAPRGDEIRIAFVAADEFTAENGHRDPLGDLIAVMIEAERNPQLHFVALKFLRDRLLPQTRLAWAQSPQTCQGVIAEAIECGVLVTSKKANPRNPAFPVTAVHLDRDHDAVAAFGSDSEVDEDEDEIVTHGAWQDA